MRLRLRKLVGLAIAVAPLLLSVSCAYMWKKPHLTVDELAGPSKGSALVKVQITLSNKAADNPECVVSRFEPKHVYVFPGSAIRWRVENKCSAPRVKYLTFTQPQPRNPGNKYEGKSPTAWNYRFCTPKIDNLESGNNEKNVLLCEVPNDVVPDVYKYGVEGAAKEDPEIEVRKGG